MEQIQQLSSTIYVLCVTLRCIMPSNWHAFLERLLLIVKTKNSGSNVGTLCTSLIYLLYPQISSLPDRATAAEVLLKLGANIKAQDPRGRSAITFAAIHGSVDCLSVLSQYGADVFHKDADGRTPLDHANE